MYINYIYIYLYILYIAFTQEWPLPIKESSLAPKMAPGSLKSLQKCNSVSRILPELAQKERPALQLTVLGTFLPVFEDSAT